MYNFQTGVLSGAPPEGEGYDPTSIEEDFWDDPSDERIQEHALGAGAQAYWGDTVGGTSAGGGMGGAWGAMIGSAVGTVVGIVDAFMTRSALITRLTEEREFREELEADFEQVMSFRKNITRYAESMLHPVEQSFRTRARAFGAQTAARGLTGAQAITAQLQAEALYREKIGPMVPAVMAAAEREGQARSMLALTAIEKKYGIDLAQQKQWFNEDMLASQMKGQELSGIIEGITDIGISAAMGIEGIVNQNQMAQKDADYTPPTDAEVSAQQRASADALDALGWEDRQNAADSMGMPGSDDQMNDQALV